MYLLHHRREVCRNHCASVLLEARQEWALERIAHNGSLAQFSQSIQDVATRWTTEVAYHDCKQLLDFGRCQSVHFSAQIASFTLTMMQYNILCTVKRFEAYETIGALFRETTTGTLELSASDRIWELILDTILEIAEITSADASELLSAVIDAKPKFRKLYQMYKLVA